MTGSPGLRAEALYLPNLVTYARILLVPAVVFVMQFDSPRNAFLAAMLFAAISCTDFLDGFLARRYNQVSVIGKFVDPLADKLLVLGVLVMLLDLGRVSPWIALILLAREIVVTTLRTLAVNEGLVIAARDLGKQKTALQMIGLWALILHYPYPLLDFAFDDPVDFHRIGTYFLYLSVAFSLVSAGDYFRGFFQGIRRGRPSASGTSPGPPSPGPRSGNKTARSVSG